MPAWALLQACSLVFDPASQAYPATGDADLDLTIGLDAEDVASPSPDQLGDIEPDPDSSDAQIHPGDVAVDSPAPPDTPDVAPTGNEVVTKPEPIQVPGNECSVAYKLGQIPLVDECAEACSGALDGWPVTFKTAEPGARWTIEATKGYVPEPAAGDGPTITSVIRFSDGNCGKASSVPDFSILVRLEADTGSFFRALTVDVQADAECPPAVCSNP